MSPVIVATKSAWKSKVNWIAALTGLGVVITQLMPFIPAEYQGKATAAVALIGAIGVWYAKTFQTDTVTPSSVTTALSAVDAMRSAGVGENQITDALNASQLKK